MQVESIIQMDSQGRVVLPKGIRQKNNKYYTCATEKDGSIHLIPVVGVITSKQAYFWTERWQKGEKEANEAIRKGKGKRIKYEDLETYLASFWTAMATYYSLYRLDPFQKKLLNLPNTIRAAAKKTIRLLAENPRHPALHTHKVKDAVGEFGGDVFEAYVTMKYRMTWEYGPDQGVITLRNIDNHDECLENP